jgi:hypothetical protein
MLIGESIVGTALRTWCFRFRLRRLSLKKRFYSGSDEVGAAVLFDSTPLSQGLS